MSEELQPVSAEETHPDIKTTPDEQVQEETGNPYLTIEHMAVIDHLLVYTNQKTAHGQNVLRKYSSTEIIIVDEINSALKPLKDYRDLVDAEKKKIKETMKSEYDEHNAFSEKMRKVVSECKDNNEIMEKINMLWEKYQSGNPDRIVDDKIRKNEELKAKFSSPVELNLSESGKELLKKILSETEVSALDKPVIELIKLLNA